MKTVHVRFALAALLICSLSGTLPAQEMNELWGSAAKTEQGERRGRFFADGNYAMFIHWGLYSEIANRWDGKTAYGASEWVMDPRMSNIQVDEYKAVARRFNPVDFDARAIAQLAKDAGMKYIVITSKHHEGFAMFQSADPFNIVDASPFGRDPMKELSDACREQGLGFGLYYSHSQDWTHPGGRKAPRVDKDGNPKTFNDYFYEKCLPQVEEITSNYGDLEIIWFDTPGNMELQYVQQLHDVVRKNQPEALISSRIGHGLYDYRSLGDMEVPLENVDGLWEGIDVTNDSWGYAWYDENWKTPKTILTSLLSTVARGGTFMLNVGPDGLGRIPEHAQQSLRSAGDWIARYPQVVYGTDSSPWKHALPWGDVIRRDNKIYLAVYEWPRTGKLWLPGLQTDIQSIRLIDNARNPNLTWTKVGTWTLIATPFQTPDPVISVIEVTLREAPVVDHTIALDPELGLDNISVAFASVEHGTVTKNTWREKFGEWKHAYQVAAWEPETTVSWTFDLPEAGTYAVSLNYLGEGRLVWDVTTDEGNTVRNQQRATEAYATYPIGWIDFATPGRHTLTVRLVEGDRTTASLGGLTLQPIQF